MCLASTARALSDKPYFAVRETIVDLKECVESLLSSVLGALRIRPNELSARFDQVVASMFRGARIIGSGSSPGFDKLHIFLTCMYVTAQSSFVTPLHGATKGSNLDFNSADLAPL